MLFPSFVADFVITFRFVYVNGDFYFMRKFDSLCSFVWGKVLKIRSRKLAPQRRSQRHMGGQMQQSNAAATALYDHPGNGAPSGDAGDAVMARWLQSAGLQHLASPMASTGVDHRLLPNLLMQVPVTSFCTISIFFL